MRQPRFAVARAATVTFAVACWGLAVSAALADTILFHLKSGERISGVVLSEDADQVVISNRWAPKISLPVSDIDRREGIPLPAAPAEAEPPPAPAAPVPSTAVAPDKAPPVAAIGVAPSPAKASPKRWRGEARVGVDLLYGEKYRQLYHGRLKVTYEQPYRTAPKKFFRNVFDYTAEYGRADGVLSANRMDANDKMDFDIGTRVFVYNVAGVGYDEVRKIDLRYEVGPGLGYRLLTRTNLALNVEVGGSYQVQQRSESPDVEKFFLRFAEDFTWGISQRVRLTEKLEFFPQVEDPGEFRARFECTLSFGLWQNLSLNLTILDVYDTQPARGVSRNELQIRSSLGITF
jgi:hypothetical protein